MKNPNSIIGVCAGYARSGGGTSVYMFKGKVYSEQIDFLNKRNITNTYESKDDREIPGCSDYWPSSYSPAIACELSGTLKHRQLLSKINSGNGYEEKALLLLIIDAHSATNVSILNY